MYAGNSIVGWIILLSNIHMDHADPETNVEVPNIDVPENETEVEICISVSTGISEQVIVTAETGPKAGSSNPAAGKRGLKLAIII